MEIAAAHPSTDINKRGQEKKLIINNHFSFQVKGCRSLWGWLRQKLMPTIYNRPWYNGFEEKNEMYIGNKMSILIGMLWMRQLRVKRSKCDERICYSVTNSTGVTQRFSVKS